MKQYIAYMDRQQVSGELHSRLLALDPAPKRQARWPQLAVPAACCALVAGIGLWQLLPGSSQNAVPTPAPISVHQNDPNSFPANSGGDAEKMMLPFLPAIQYPDLTSINELAHSIAAPDGAYTVELTEEQICLLLWGSQERMYSAHFKEKAGDLPWLLCWDGYTISGHAWYDGSGSLWQIDISGSLDDAHYFELRMAPGDLPPTCIIEDGAAVTEVRGVEVSAWKRYYDRNGDGIKEHICTSAFLVDDIGIRFQSVTQEDSQISNLFINYATCGHLSLEHLLTNEDIPDWREEHPASLAAARQEAGFAPYLPQHDFPGYGEFESHLSYQEGSYNYLHLRWSRGLDDVSVTVRLPEGEPPYHEEPIDISVPESYDMRLYDIPWAGSVPEEYRFQFYSPVFRAGDMSLSVVEARTYTPNELGDTNSPRANFKVLHEDGTLVEYSCEGLTAQQVWATVEGTLKHTG